MRFIEVNGTALRYAFDDRAGSGAPVLVLIHEMGGGGVSPSGSDTVAATRVVERCQTQREGLAEMLRCE
jgi:hypothetical protein